MSIDANELRNLVDWERGLVSAHIFIDEDIYQLELDRIFGRTWLWLAHDSMIPKPGDFYSTYMGGDPVIVARQKDGSVKAFLNVCRHRGMKVCRAEEGNTNAFMCTYHGWTYDGSGSLISVPNFEDAYYGEADMSKWGLVQVRTESYKGFWFGNFDASAPSLIDYLGDMAWYLDSWIDHADGGIEFIPGAVKWVIQGNWKIAAEQFAGDGYHFGVTHSSAAPGSLGDGRLFASRQGHGLGLVKPYEGRADTIRGSEDAIVQYRAEKLEATRRRLGDSRAVPVTFWTVFPNFSGLGGPSVAGVWHPKGPNKFEIWRYFMVEKNAPDEIKKGLQRSMTVTDGPAGMIEMDDGENWNFMGQLLEQGYQARQIRWNYQMGLGHDRVDDPEYPGHVGPRLLGEMPQRNFYRRWLEFMASEQWPHIPSDELSPRVGTRLK